jgi:hypothetical protein
MNLTMMERVGDRWEKMEESCSTGQSPQWAVVPVEEEEEEEVDKIIKRIYKKCRDIFFILHISSLIIVLART